MYFQWDGPRTATKRPVEQFSWLMAQTTQLGEFYIDHMAKMPKTPKTPNFAPRVRQCIFNGNQANLTIAKYKEAYLSNDWRYWPKTLWAPSERSAESVGGAWWRHQATPTCDDVVNFKMCTAKYRYISNRQVAAFKAGRDHKKLLKAM
jgi:hypothetical protein